MDALATVLERIEKESGIPRRVLMERAGLTYFTWNAWKTGKRQPQPESLRAVERALREASASQAALADAVSALTS